VLFNSGRDHRRLQKKRRYDAVYGPQPALFGLANLTDIYFNDYLKTVSPCLIGTLTTERVNDIIKEKALWGLLSKQLMFVYNRLYNNVMPQGARRRMR
jgi:hypothetical protein